MTLRVGSLFTGAGGFDQGFLAAGCRIAWMSEIDPLACAVLRRHFPLTPLLGDVRDLHGGALDPVDVIVAGFPCQDLSVAGNRAGLAGDRSGLFWEIPRMIREMREATDGRCPTWALLENVPGLFSSHGGRDFAAILAGLSECGALDIVWRVLDAQYFGVAQRRRRLFALADFRAERAARVLLEPARLCGDPQAGRGAAEELAGTLGSRPANGRGGWNGDTDRMTFVADVADTLTAPDTRHRDRNGKRQDGSRREANGLNARNNRYDLESQAFVVETLRSHPRPGSNSTGALAFNARQDPILSEEVSGPLDTDGHGAAVALSENQRAELRETPVVRSVTGGGGKPGQGYAAIRNRSGVRRLMPVECCRLMGWPDDWVAYREDGTVIPVTHQYRLIGNGVVAPVSYWIAKRLVAVVTRDRALCKDKAPTPTPPTRCW